MSPNIGQDPDFTETHSQVIEEGPVSTTSRFMRVFNDGRDPEWVVAKKATIRRKLSKEPHDIVKESRIVSGTSHPNIIEFLGQRVDTKTSTLSFFMPYIPYSLSNLLSSPTFSPYLLADRSVTTRVAQFSLLAKSLVFQIISAVSYLHLEGIAHRDIKPHNILLTNEACVKLIDFGISWKESESESAKEGDLWPENPEKMYFEVSTGPYRAPELLFGTRSYHAKATDLWSLGVTLAEFFTPLRLSIIGDDYDDPSDNLDDDGEDDQEMKPFIIPKTLRFGNPNLRWVKQALFNAERGEIGLAWSIFKIRGTPTTEIWPTFKDLPHSSRVSFNIVPPVALSSLLPNLPPAITSDTDAHFPVQLMTPSPLDLLHRFLVYPESERLQASEALRHPWFIADPPILLPVAYPAKNTLDPNNLGDHHLMVVWEGKTLGEWLATTIPAIS